MVSISSVSIFGVIPCIRFWYPFHPRNIPVKSTTHHSNIAANHCTFHRPYEKLEVLFFLESQSAQAFREDTTISRVESSAEPIIASDPESIPMVNLIIERIIETTSPNRIPNSGVVGSFIEYRFTNFPQLYKFSRESNNLYCNYILHRYTPKTYIIFMEANTLTTYSFKEKYFQVLPEGRIRRYQYFIRVVIITLLIYATAFIAGVISYFLGNIWNILIIITSIIIPIVQMYSMRSLNIKRVRDIESRIFTPKCIKNITTTLYSVAMFFWIYYILWEQGIINDYVRTSLWQPNPIFLNPFDTTISYPWHQQLMNIVNIVSFALLTILFLYLLFVPWKSWDNEYGKDPIKTKITFLG